MMPKYFKTSSICLCTIFFYHELLVVQVIWCHDLRELQSVILLIQQLMRSQLSDSGRPGHRSVRCFCQCHPLTVCFLVLFLIPLNHFWSQFPLINWARYVFWRRFKIVKTRVYSGKNRRAATASRPCLRACIYWLRWRHRSWGGDLGICTSRVAWSLVCVHSLACEL